MIKGVGIDSVEVERVKKIVDKGDAFAKKVLTPNEFAQYQKMKGKRKVEYLGGRFSLNVETLWDDLGHPVMTSTKFDGKIFPSITHDNYEIITFVVLEEN